MHYVIAGAGPAAVAAAENLRSLDADGKITMIGAQSQSPYSRMALPYFLTGKIEEQGTYLRRAASHFEDKQIDVVHGRVANVESAAHKVILEDGTAVEYDKLLVATGAEPIIPPVSGMDDPRVQQCWHLEDAERDRDGSRFQAARLEVFGAASHQVRRQREDGEEVGALLQDAALGQHDQVGQEEGQGRETEPGVTGDQRGAHGQQHQPPGRRDQLGAQEVGDLEGAEEHSGGHAPGELRHEQGEHARGDVQTTSFTMVRLAGPCTSILCNWSVEDLTHTR